MAGLAKMFNKTLKRQINMYAAWFPVTNTLKVGDFGLVEGGVFRQLGNIGDYFQIDFSTAEGPATSMDYSSEGTTVIKFVGGAQVDALPNIGELEAKLSINFSRANSFHVKAELSSLQMSNTQVVAWELAKNPKWDRRYKVISEAYSGNKCVVLASSEKGTSITFTGSVDAIKQVEAGKVDTDVGFTSNNVNIFKSVGESGVIGLRMFKIRSSGNVQFLRETDVSIESDFGDELEDDL
jgi:hypothetical protein